MGATSLDLSQIKTDVLTYASTFRTLIGLGNIDNTSDANKPISSATQEALDLKANSSALGSYLPLSGGTLTGGLSGTTATFSVSVSGQVFDVPQNGSNWSQYSFSQSGTQRASLIYDPARQSVGLRNNNYSSNDYSIYVDGSGNFQIRNGATYNSSPVFTVSPAGAVTAAGTLATRNGANATRFELYGTYTDASNYRRLYLSSTTAGAFTLGVEGLGTGASGNTLTVASALTLNSSLTATGAISSSSRISSDSGFGKGLFVTASGSDQGQIVADDGALVIRSYGGNGIRYRSPSTHNFQNSDGTAWASIGALNGTFTGALRLPTDNMGIYFSASGNTHGRISSFGTDFYFDLAGTGNTIFRTNNSITTNLTLYGGASLVGALVATGIAIGDLSTRLVWDANHVIAQRNATNSQTLRVYNTFTDASNFIRQALSFTIYSGTVYAQHVAEGLGTGAVNIPFVISPRGTGAFILGPVPDGTATGGNARGAQAVDLQLIRTGAAQVAQGQASLVAGIANTAVNFASVAIGDSNTAQGDVSFATGRYADANLYGSRAHAGWRFSSIGDAQYTRLVVSNRTTNATPTTLFLRFDESRRVTLNAGEILGFIANIVGSRSDGSAVAHYVRKGCIKRVGSTTSLVGNIETVGTDYEDNPLTDVSITADDVNDALQIQVTGIDGETWRWVATIEAVDLGFGT